MALSLNVNLRRYLKKKRMGVVLILMQSNRIHLDHPSILFLILFLSEKHNIGIQEKHNNPFKYPLLQRNFAFLLCFFFTPKDFAGFILW